MSEPQVSVVTATFGPPRFLRAALDGALAQTLGDLEVLVGDDSGDDETRALVESLADRRVSYARNERTLGPAANHRRLLARCRGRYLAILNQDDLWDGNLLERLVGRLEATPSAILAFCDHWLVDEQGGRLPEGTARATERYGRGDLAAGERRPFFDLLERQSIPLAMGAVFRNEAEVLGPLPDRVGAGYDLWLTYRLARTGRGACYLPERLSAWRVHGAQLSARAGAASSLAAAECWRAAAADPACASRRSGLRALARGAWRSALAGALRAGDPRGVAQALAFPFRRPAGGPE